MNTNLKSPFLLSSKLAKHCAENKLNANIINISSVHAERSTEIMSAYAASKAALENFTRVASIEWAPSIRVNSIAPGFTLTERNSDAFEENKSEWLNYIPLGRYGETEDIGRLAVFLSSDASSWITGQSIVIDGGTSARIFFPLRD